MITHMIDTKWKRRFMGQALYYSTFSKDPSTKVGCVIVNDMNQPVGHGCNGFSRYNEDRDEDFEDRGTKYLQTIHAEENAMYNATATVRDCVAFVTHPPCVPCLERLDHMGIKAVYAFLPSPEFADRWCPVKTLKSAEKKNIEVFYFPYEEKMETFEFMVSEIYREACK